MRTLRQLLSASEDHVETNRQVVGLYLSQPACLREVADLLHGRNPEQVVDAIEILSQVAAEYPAWVRPYVPSLLALLTDKTTRVRWKAQQAPLGLSASDAKALDSSLKQLRQIIHHHHSAVVRDDAVYMLGQVAKLNPVAAERTWAICKDALGVHHGLHDASILKVLVPVAAVARPLRPQIYRCAQGYRADPRGAVRAAAQILMSLTVAGQNRPTSNSSQP
jgi:hypothetical protein